MDPDSLSDVADVLHPFSPSTSPLPARRAVTVIRDDIKRYPGAVHTRSGHDGRADDCWLPAIDRTTPQSRSTRRKIHGSCRDVPLPADLSSTVWCIRFCREADVQG
ncbi:MAG: hypothetical protein ABIS86_06220 [Streptosporangiaceae bacterium]